MSFPGNQWTFQQDNARPCATTVQLGRHTVLDWAACRPDLSSVEKVWRIVKRKTTQGQMSNNGEIFILLLVLVSSVSKLLKTVDKRKFDVTRL